MIMGIRAVWTYLNANDSQLHMSHARAECPHVKHKSVAPRKKRVTKVKRWGAGRGGARRWRYIQAGRSGMSCYNVNAGPAACKAVRSGSC